MGVNNVHTKNRHRQCAITVASKRDYRTVHANLLTGGARFTSGISDFFQSCEWGELSSYEASTPAMRHRRDYRTVHANLLTGGARFASGISDFFQSCEWESITFIRRMDTSNAPLR